MRKGLSTWKKMIALWHEQDVPPVEIRPYEFHMDFACWRTKVGPYICDSNPLRTTAYHLAVHLNGASTSLVATYKIFAFCVECELIYPHIDALAAGFAEEGTDARGWWSQNSRRVLPSGKAGHDFERDELRRWDNVVLAAAMEWTAIAERWTLIRVPELMLDGSQEQLEWDRYVAKRREETDRREYERLKQKFGE